MMNFKNIKKRIEEYRDFYGQDVIFIDKPKTIEDCRATLIEHYQFLEMQNNDALKSLDRFRRELGLD